MTTPHLRIAVLQSALTDQLEANVARIDALARQAADQGAQIVLASELFEGLYFPQRKDPGAFALAKATQDHPTIAHMQALASELNIVIPVSFFERAGDAYYNSIAIVDADGSVLGVYRKSHIPSGAGYEEKFFFRPGDTGFRVWDTQHGVIGVGICWDQWFPEAARAMALQGAEILLYPTAIGSEPENPDEDTRDPWRRVMVGHAVANAVPVAAANRVGTEDGLTFYGSSFIADQRGELVATLNRQEEGVAVASLDREELKRYRASWDFFGDRRPDLYSPLSADRKGR